MKLFLIVVAWCCCAVSCDFGNGHYYWRVGKSTDFVPSAGSLTGGVVLAGGGADVDPAMQWFLRKAAGGDVIVFRNARNGATAADYPNAAAYNSYFYSELGVSLNSVETILLNGRATANNQFVADKVAKAEAVFFTGGDQWYYYDFINGTLLQTALNQLVNVRRGAIGGTSAGCAIQGEFGFTAQVGTIDSAAALANPYASTLTLGRNLISNQWLTNTITDTHFNNPDRRGCHVTFMARIYQDFLKGSNNLVRGIGVDEKTAVCVDSKDGTAYVFGFGHAYFIHQATVSDFPEQCIRNKELDWYRNKQALKVYRVPADLMGAKWFDLSSWTRGVGGTWLHMYVDYGRFYMV